MGNIASALIGAALIGYVLWEVFNDLFRPGKSGALSDQLGRWLFSLCRRSPRLLPLAGPLAVVAVIATWVAGLVLGFALVFYHAYPDAFRTSTGAVPPESAHLVSVLYFSFETLVTLGYGDLVPQAVIPRSLATIEAVVGFGLLTASVSSIVLFYPALSRMRLLARGVSHIVHAEHATGARVAASGSDVILSALARDVARARIDLVHFPIIYFFASHDPTASVARWTSELTRLAAEARACECPPHVRLAGAALDGALDELAAILDERFLTTHEQDRQRIFQQFARDHLISV